jgi:hypothetical protein
MPLVFQDDSQNIVANNDRSILFVPRVSSRLQDTFQSVQNFDPIRTADVINIAQNTGEPEEFVDNNLEDLKKIQKNPTFQQWKQYESMFPGTAQFLSDPKNMATAKDVLPELAQHESALKFGWNLLQFDFTKPFTKPKPAPTGAEFSQNFARGLGSGNENDLAFQAGVQLGKGEKSGQLNVSYAQLRYEQMLETLQTGRRSTRNESKLQQLEAQMAALERPIGFNPWYFTGEQLPNYGLMSEKAGFWASTGGVLGGGLALIAGNAGPQAATPEEVVTVPAAVLTGMKVGAQLGGKIGLAQASAILEGGSAYGDFIKIRDKYGNPIDPQVAAQAALVVGVLNSGLEMAQVSSLLKTIPGGSKVLDFLGRQEIKNLAKQSGGNLIRAGVKEYLINMLKESGQEFAQETVTQLGGEMAKTISDQEFDKKPVADILAQSSQVISPTIQSQLIFGIPGLGSHTYQGIKQIQGANQAVQVYEQIGKVAAGSQYLDRMPENYAKFVADQVKNGPIENVYVDAHPLVSFLQSAVPDITREQVVQEISQVFGLGDEIQTALDTGGSIKISYATWLEKVVKTPLYDAVKNDVKFSEDGLTYNQAAVEEKRIADMITLEQQAAEPQIIHNNIIRDNFNLIYQDVKEKLTAAGRPKNIREREFGTWVDRNAKLWASRMIAEASRRGVNPMELYQGINQPEIVQGARENAGALNQSADRFAAKGNLNGKALYFKGELIYPDSIYQKSTDIISRGFDPFAEETGEDAGHDALYMAQSMQDGDFNSIIEMFNEEGTKFIPYGVHIIKGNNNFSFRLDQDGFLQKDGYLTKEQIFNEFYNAAKALKNDGFTGKLEIPEIHYKGTIDNFIGETLNQSAVETPEFKKWFKSSKVVDEQGNPLVVFHFGGKDIQEFDLNRTNDMSNYGQGFYFMVGPDGPSSLYELASTTGIMDDEIRGYPTEELAYQSLKDDGRIVEAYINIKNPVPPEKISEYMGENGLKQAYQDGYDGIINVQEYPNGKKYGEIAVLNSNQIKSIDNVGTFDPSKSNIYMQDNSEPRAQVNINQDKSIIALFNHADQSSFIHESAHVWMEDSFRFVRSGQADEIYLANWRTLADWLEITDEQETLTTDQQEQFARGFEAYLMEGKAPSEGLQKVFASFRRWLIQIYRDIAGLKVELSDPVRKVMDRMVATDDEITQREALNGYMFDVVREKDVSPTTWLKLRELKEKAHEMAINQLLRPQMDELKPDREEFLAQERDRLRKVIREQVATQPIYRIAEPIRQQFGTRKNPLEIARKFLAGGDGLTPTGQRLFEAIAEAYGYSSGDELAQKMIKAPKFNDVVEEQLAVEMAGRYGDLNQDTAAFQYEAEAALRNDDQMDVLALEKAILQDLIHQEETNQLSRQVSLQRARSLAANARKYAKSVLAEKPYQEATAATAYFTAERVAAVRESQEYAKGNFTEMHRFAEQRLLNHALALEAVQLTKEIDKSFRYLNKFTGKSRPEIGQEFSNQIDKILARFELAQPSLNVQEDPTTLTDWIKSREQWDDAAIPETIANETFVKNYQDLTLGELRDLVDAVKNIETIARNEKRQLTDEKERDFQVIVKEITGRIRRENKELFPKNYDPNVTKLESILHSVRSFVASHQKVEYIVRALDGYKDQGPVWRYVILPMMRAMDKEYTLRRNAGEKYTKLLRDYLGKDLSHLATKKLYIPGMIHAIFPKGVTKENILMMALNWGATDNRNRLMDAYSETIQYTDEDIKDIMRENQADVDKLGPGKVIMNEKRKELKAAFESVFDRHMTQSDWNFVQGTWDMIEEFWPMIAEVEKARKGIEPKKRETIEVVTKYGTYKGGYFHIEYDSRLSEQASRQSEQENLKGLTEITYLKPSTKTGFTKEVSEMVANRPLNLHLSVIDKHLADVIHMVSFINALRDVDRLLNHREVMRVIKETMGDEVYKQFRPWLMNIGYEYRSPMTPVENLLSRARQGSSVVNMGFKFTTAFSQYAGLPSIMEKVGNKRTLSAVLEFHKDLITGQAMKKAQEVFEKSEMMRNRMKDRDRDIRDTTKKLISTSAYDKITDTYFALTGLFDFAITVPGWIAAYDKNIAEQMKAGEVALMNGVDPNDILSLNEEMAVRYADGVIRETQGSGDVVNMAAIQRGTELQKLLTQFYSYFSVYANKQIEAVQRAKRRGEYGQLVSFAIYWWFVPALASELLAGRGPSGDDPDEMKWAKWALTNVLKYPASAFIVVRDVVNALGGKFGGYEMTPSAAALQKGVELWNVTVNKAVNDDEIDWGKAGKAAFEFGGYWLKYPSRQIEITVGNVYDAIVNGEDFYLQDVFFPKPAERR